MPKSSAILTHHPKMVRMKAEMAITHAISRKRAYVYKYRSQLNTDLLLLRRMLDDDMLEPISITEIVAQTDNIVDQCIMGEDHL